MKSFSATALVVVCVGLGYAQTKIDLRYSAKNPDFSAMTHTRPVQVGTTLPSTCNSGELFINSTAPAGQGLYLCSSGQNWSQVASTSTSLGACTVDAANNLACPGNLFSGTGASAGMLSLYEVSSNGNNAISLAAPDLIPVGYTLQLPATAPTTGNNTLQFSAPQEGVAMGSWGSGGGGGTPVTPSIVTTYSSAPPCVSGIAGQLFLIPSGAGINGQCDGTTTRWFYNHMAVTPPGPKSGWTVKQADTGIENPDGSIYISATSTSAINALVKTVSNKTSFILGMTDELPSANYMGCYALVVDSAGVIAFGDFVSASSRAQDDARAFAPDYSGSPGSPSLTVGGVSAANGLHWIKMYLSGGSLHVARSPDGLHWIDNPSRINDTSTSFTGVGFGCTTFGGTAATAGMTVYSAVVQ